MSDNRLEPDGLDQHGSDTVIVAGAGLYPYPATELTFHLYRGTAVFAATTAVILDRARAPRRRLPAPTA